MDSVLNWLWQGALVALAASAIAQSMGPWRAEARFRTLGAGLLLVLLLPLMPFLAATLSVAPSPGSPALGTPAISIPVAWWNSPAIVWSVCLVWPVAHLIRVGVAWRSLRRAKQNLGAFPAHVEARLRWWMSVKGTGRHTRLVLSHRVRSAAVLGCPSPVIAIAPALLDRLEPEDLDRIVIHEWAHVQRRDDVTNVLMVLARTLAGWHPAVWWLDRQLKTERESACDEMVVGLTGAAKDYARCLTRLAGLPATPVWSLASLAILSSTGLRHRVVRILLLARHVAGRPRPFFMKAGGLALCLLAITVGGVRLIETVLPSATASLDRLTMLPAMTSGNAHTSDGPSSRDRAQASGASTARTRATRSQATKAPTTPGDASVAPNVPSGPGTPEAMATEAVGEPLVVVPAEMPMAAVPSRALDTITALDVPSLGQTGSLVLSRDLPINTVEPSPWRSATEAGIALGRTSTEAGVAMAGFFSRVSRRIAGSF